MSFWILRVELQVTWCAVSTVATTQKLGFVLDCMRPHLLDMCNNHWLTLSTSLNLLRYCFYMPCVDCSYSLYDRYSHWHQKIRFKTLWIEKKCIVSVLYSPVCGISSWASYHSKKHHPPAENDNVFWHRFSSKLLSAQQTKTHLQ